MRICRVRHSKSRNRGRTLSFLGFGYLFSYCRRCLAFARHALMIRMYSPRSVCGTTSRLPALDRPSKTHRSSLNECSASRMTMWSQSEKAVSASSNETPWFRMFSLAFFGSHSNFKRCEYNRWSYLNGAPSRSTGRRRPFDRHVSRLATDLECYHGSPALKAEMAMRYQPRITIRRRPAKSMLRDGGRICLDLLARQPSFLS